MPWPQICSSPVPTLSVSVGSISQAELLLEPASRNRPHPGSRFGNSYHKVPLAHAERHAGGKAQPLGHDEFAFPVSCEKERSQSRNRVRLVNNRLAVPESRLRTYLSLIRLPVGSVPTARLTPPSRLFVLRLEVLGKIAALWPDTNCES